MTESFRMRRGFVDTQAGQAHYVTAGTGKPVLLVHPSPMSWNYFRDVIPLIAAAGLRAIAIDTMGYGDSERPNPPFTTINQYASAIADVIDGLNLDIPTVVGHQTGAVIVTELGAAWPEKVGALVLSEAFNWNKPERRKIHEQRHIFFPPKEDGSHLLQLWNRHGSYGLRTGGLDLAERLFFNQLRVNQGEQPVAEFGNMGWDGSAPWAMCRYELWDRTPLIIAPTLILYGSTSDLSRAQIPLKESIRRSKTAVYESRGIGGPLDDLHGWTNQIIEFAKDPGI